MTITVEQSFDSRLSGSRVHFFVIYFQSTQAVSCIGLQRGKCARKAFVDLAVAPLAPL